MKQHLAVIGLFLQMRLKKILIILAALPLVSLGGYIIVCRAAEQKGNVASFTDCTTFFLIVYGISFLTMFAVLVLDHLDMKGHSEYTRARLGISERTFFLWDAVICALCFLMLWQAEVILIFALNWKENVACGMKGAMSALRVVTEREAFYSVIFPTGRYLVMGFRILQKIALGFACAEPGVLRKDKVADMFLPIWTLFALMALVAEVFEVVGGGYFVLLGSLAILVIFILAMLSFKWLHSGEERTENESEDC